MYSGTISPNPTRDRYTLKRVSLIQVLVMKVLLATLIAPLASLFMAVAAQAELRTQVVEYNHGNTILEGYLAYDDEFKGPRPGVLIVHEWTGLGTYVKQRADQLAKLGYVAFAADIYGKGIRPDNPKDAATQAGIYRADRQLLRDRATTSLAVLKKNPLANPEQIAAIGYCFGGGTVLELARSGAPIAGVVSFHGNLDTPNPADAKNIQAKVLVLHGAIDPYVPPEQVAAFEKEMNAAKVDWQLISYGGGVVIALPIRRLVTTPQRVPLTTKRLIGDRLPTCCSSLKNCFLLLQRKRLP
ncbi:dienelactone hydrolase family protein [Leptothermofonsia sichuanensis]|uniref:dienelactone hydrolase family protein n=1 Tax=Leptothermofonsia sichuanensis TaxID=2917832 RepID=UPI001EEF925D